MASPIGENYLKISDHQCRSAHQSIFKFSERQMHFSNSVMSGTQENVLESIIKVETQKFKPISIDDVLRFKAKM